MTQYKLVPVEPTEEMLHEALEAHEPLDGDDRDFIFEFQRTYRAMLSAAPTIPQSQSLLSDEVFNLYRAVNSMMARIGMHGEVSSDHESVDAVMNALYDLDGGNVRQRIEDLREKAFMPETQAMRLAVDEYITCNESKVRQQDDEMRKDKERLEFLMDIQAILNSREIIDERIAKQKGDHHG